jgi:two-component system OmpR family sensor kinase
VEAPRGTASLRSRLAAWYAAALAVPLVAFAVVSWGAFAGAVVDRTDRDIAGALAVFTREATAERNRAASDREALETTVREMRFGDVRIIVRDAAGALVAAGVEADSGRVGDGDPVLGAIVAHGTDTSAYVVPGPAGGTRVVSMTFRLRAAPYVASGAYAMREDVAVLGRIRSLFFIAIPLLVVVAAAGAWIIARRNLAPVAGMAARAGEISAANLGPRLEVGGPQELARLAAAFNALLDRLSASFDQHRRFMADASHELRTPTAVMKAEAEVALAREHREEPEYREALEVVRRSAGRLTRIVDDLFLLARADAGHLVVRDDVVYLDEVVHDAVRAMEPVGAGRGVTVRIASMGQATVRGDAELLGRVLLNLIDNAVKHSPRGADVIVDMGAEAGRHRVSVVDVGPGIPAADAARVFERFYRGDAARARADGSVTDGAGLGLAIARRIAAAHGGTLDLVESRPGRTEFRLVLPAGG